MQLLHVCCCTKCTSDFLPLGCARAQSPNYVNSCAVMATKPACTHCKTEKLKTWVLGLISVKLIGVTWSVGEFRWNKPDNRWVRNTFSRKHKTGRELPVYTQRKFFLIIVIKVFSLPLYRGQTLFGLWLPLHSPSSRTPWCVDLARKEETGRR